MIASAIAYLMGAVSAQQPLNCRPVDYSAMARGLLEDFRHDGAGGIVEDRIAAMAGAPTPDRPIFLPFDLVEWDDAGDFYTMDNLLGLVFEELDDIQFLGGQALATSYYTRITGDSNYKANSLPDVLHNNPGFNAATDYNRLSVIEQFETNFPTVDHGEAVDVTDNFRTLFCEFSGD